MHHPFSQFLPLIALLTTALSIPASPILKPHNITTTPTLKSAIHCDGTFWRWSFINTPDCLHALRQLPPTHAHGMFHNIGADDQFQLPYNTIKGDCSIVFDMVNPAAEEESTWDTLRIAASELVFGCAVKSQMGLTRGGWTTSGHNDGIVITVQKPRRGDWRPGRVVAVD